VAHSWRKAPRRLTVAAAVAMALAATEAGALALGEPEVRSALGESLDLRVPVTIAAGESIEPSCFSLLRDSGGDVPRIENARVSVERSVSGTFLRLRSANAVTEPAMQLGIAASCKGQSGEYKRDYALLFDPRRSPAAAPASAPATSAIAAVREIAATLIARIGDTLESIANAIFPNNRAAKKAYIEALRETNPPLAALGESDPIPLDTPIALPDLRTFARSRTPHEAQTQVAAAPASGEPRVAAPKSAAPRATPPKTVEPKALEPKGDAEQAAPKKAAAPRKQPAPTREPKVAAAAPSDPGERSAPAPAKAQSRAQPPGGFVLKLSSGEVDLSRSRGIDDRSRAQLRERLLVLDADDQVAALLALKNSVKQLESRVAELQLKLSGMPSSFPPREAPKPAEAPKVAVAPKAEPKPEPPKVEAPKAIEAPKVEPPKAEPKVIEPPKVEAKPEPAKIVEPPKVVEPPKAVETPKAIEPPAVEAKPEPPKAVEPTPAKPPRRVIPHATAETDWLTYGLWGLAVFLMLAAILLAWRLMRRRRAEAAEDEMFEPPPEDTLLDDSALDDEIVVAEEHVSAESIFAEQPIHLPAEEGRRELDADVELPTRLAENTDDLRRRYIEERFPEITKGAIVLDDADSVVKGARLFYEDGAVTRAIELLQYAVERKPEEIKAWLALFEIYRLERSTAEFAELARRFKESHGKTDYWRKVQYFGREIDPGNTLYQEEPLNTFETIGPSQAKKLAAAASFDPVAENWLGAPMDFENEVLANDLRKALMADASITEDDLIANPMPALRNVEMFNVA
jgi:pilus assembly protein FimV